MNTVTRLYTSICTFIFIAVITTGSVQAQSIDGVIQSIGQGADKVVDSIDVSKFSSKPQRDLLTLAIGGAVGFAAGGLLTNMGILNIQVLSVAIIPIASGLAGLYMANEGYFDTVRNMLGSKPVAP